MLVQFCTAFSPRLPTSFYQVNQNLFFMNKISKMLWKRDDNRFETLISLLFQVGTLCARTLKSLKNKFSKEKDKADTLVGNCNTCLDRLLPFQLALNNWSGVSSIFLYSDKLLLANKAHRYLKSLICQWNVKLWKIKRPMGTLKK